MSPREAAACLSGSVCQGPKGSASSRHGEEQRGPQCPWEFLPSCSGWGGFVPFVHACCVNMNLPHGWAGTSTHVHGDRVGRGGGPLHILAVQHPPSTCLPPGSREEVGCGRVVACVGKTGCSLEPPNPHGCFCPLLLIFGLFSKSGHRPPVLWEPLPPSIKPLPSTGSAPSTGRAQTPPPNPPQPPPLLGLQRERASLPSLGIPVSLAVGQAGSRPQEFYKRPR